MHPSLSCPSSPKIFLNQSDISLHISNCKIYKYADDTSLCAFSESTLSLQNKLSADLKIIEDWCIINRYGTEVQLKFDV